MISRGPRRKLPRGKVMTKLFNRFFRDDSGAVTVDWVVLTAAVVALAGVAFTALQTSTGGLGSNVGAQLTNSGPS